MSDTLSRLTAALADRYTIKRELGEGGMATVYLAEDLKHKRKVALKVLRPELAAVLGAERFVQEITTTANLQHPHILPLFDSGEADSFLYYVMPYIEGETLRDKLDRETQLGIEEAVKITTEVADALDYAHRHRVIHRDIKPENILLHDGRPMVADFGIALAVSAAAGGRMTETGLSLGTPHYMSPEQATAEKDLTGRSDIYSLGAMAYEMLAGDPPHTGSSAQQIIMRIVTDEARAITELRKSVPPNVAAAVGKALEKLPADRFATAQEFADALAGKGMADVSGHPAMAEASSAEVAMPGSARHAVRWRAVVPWLVAAASLAAAVTAWSGATRGTEDALVVRYEIPLRSSATMDVGRGNVLAISTSGRFVAYTARSGDGTSRVQLRAADDLVPREVPGSEQATNPFFSPDGTWIGFWAAGQFRKVPVSGGRTVVLGDGPLAPATWSPSGWVVATVPEGLAKAPAGGGTFEVFAPNESDRDETAKAFPVALPDGEHVLYASTRMGGSAASRIAVASLRDGSSTILDLPGSFPLGVLEGHVIYTTAAGVVMAAPFDLGARRVTGTALALVDQTAVDATIGTSYAQLSPDGSLAFISGVPRRQPVLIGPDGIARPFGEPGPYSWPRLSPDGGRFAVTVGSLARREVWIYDLTSSTFSQLTNGGTINDRPEWTPDGRAVLFRSDRGERNAIWSQPRDGSAAPQLVYGRDDSQIDEGVLSPDGLHLVVQRDSTGNGEGWLVSVSGDTTASMYEQELSAYGARFSPDGNWLAYTGGGAEVYVRPFPSLSGRIQISFGGGATPVWSADGTRIYYVNGPQLMVATIGSTQPFTISSRAVVLDRGYTFDAVHADYDLAPDGRTILALQSPGQDVQLVVVRNFGAELRARIRQAPR